MAGEEPPFRVADLIDKYLGAFDSEAAVKSKLRVLEPNPILQNFGGRKTFCGKVTTIRTFHHNLPMKEILVSEEGQGRVLIVDNQGSLKCAMFGDAITMKAAKKGWEGIVVNGCIRDADTMATFDIGIKAIATNPMKPGKTGGAARDVPVSIGGVTIHPGDWLYSDSDGILISPEPLELVASKANKAS